MRRIILLTFVLSVLVVSAFSSLYQLRPGDVLNVNVYGHTELSGQYTIGPDGHVQIVPIGDISVSGLTIQQVVSIVTSRMKAFVSNPHVTISIQKYAPFLVYLLGSVKNPGAIQISEPAARLSTIISLGGGVLPNADLYNIRIIDKNGISKTVNFSGIYNGSSNLYTTVSFGDTVIVPSEEQTGIFVMGEVEKPGIVKYTPQMSIIDVIQKVGGFLKDADLKNVLVFSKRNEETSSRSYDLSGFYNGKIPDITVFPGSIFVIPRQTERFAYVLGAVQKPGIVTFMPKESETLLNALSKVGNIVKERSTGKVKVVSGANTREYNIDDILSGKVNVQLQNGSLVYVGDIQNTYVYVVGAVKNPGRITFVPGMPETIGSAISEAGGAIQGQNLGKVVVVQNGKKETYDLNSITSGASDKMVENGALIYIPRASERYVYVLGAVENPGRADFGPNEPETLMVALAKAKGFSKDAANEVKIIYPDGTEKIVKVSNDYSGKTLQLQTGSTIIVEKTSKWAYVYGRVSSPGRIMIQPEETLSLRTVLAKAGVISQNYVAYVSYHKSTVASYTAELLKEKDIIIPSGTFIFVEEQENKNIYTYGEFKNAGQQTYLPNQNVTIGEIISRAGGLNKSALGQVVVVNPVGGTYIYTKEDISSNPFTPIPNGAFVYAPKSETNYVAVLGNVAKSGTFEISSNTPLLKVLGMAGGLLDWNLGQLEIISATQTTTFKISPKAFASVEVHPGQIVYVPPTSAMKVYVFGQVKNPGVFQYTKGMTALEAILRAGGTTQKAELSRTFLFKGGPNNSPEVLDLSQNGLSSNNLILSPGDILYVPQSISVDIMQVIGNVTSLFNLANSGIQLWRNVSGQ